MLKASVWFLNNEDMDYESNTTSIVYQANDKHEQQSTENSMDDDYTQSEDINQDENARNSSSSSSPSTLSPQSSSTTTNYVWKTVSWQSNKRKKQLKQSSYVLSMIKQQDFINRGAQLLDFGIYWIKKEFDGTPEKETLALVGIPMFHVNEFFDNESQLVRNIRSLQQLSYIQNVDELCCGTTSTVLKKFHKTFEQFESHYLLLLNIEPVGEGKYKRLYPYPRFTLPGGSMEPQDSDDFFNCALREFKEETHIDLYNSNCYEIMLTKRLVKDFDWYKLKNNSAKNKFKFFRNCNLYKNISMYFVLKLLC